MRSSHKRNRKYFQYAYRTGDHEWPAEEPCPYAKEFLAKIRRVIPNGRLLDLGCGEGRHTILAARLGFETVGVDYEPLALHLARKYAKKADISGLCFRREDALNLSFPDSSFDAVLDCGCLHHLPKADWEAYRSGVLRVLKPRGWFILTVFSPYHYLFRGGREWQNDEDGYRRCFTPEYIEAAFGYDFDMLDRKEERDGELGFWHFLMRSKSDSSN